MSFLFVDTAFNTDTSALITGQKVIHAEEPYLITNAFGQTIFMPSLLGETIGQLAAWAVMNALDFTKRPVAGVVSQVNIMGEVKPGDVVSLEANIDKLDALAVEYHGCARVGDKKVFEIVNALGPLMPMADFIDKEVVIEQYHAVTEGMRPSNQEEYQPLKPFGLALTQFDNLIEYHQDAVIATKDIKKEAPYFSDHFPLKPVLPLTLLLQSKLNLMATHVKEFYGDDYRSVSVRKIKMSRFVVPGERVETRMNLKKASKSKLIYSFKSYVGEQRVCVCEAIFAKGAAYE